MSTSSPYASPFATSIVIRDACLCLHAQRTARALARLFDEAFKSLGLSSGQFSLLNAVNRPEPASMSAVANLLAMDRTTLTANLKPLARRGLVEVLVDGRDRRARRLRLTAQGSALLAGATPVWIETHRRLEDANLTGLAEKASAISAA
jgi:DNA-binding MarR family transcriptional regulator